jgi:hypothetical protein
MASGEDMLAGLIGAALLPLIALRVRRGLKEGRLPLYRTYVDRDESASKFSLLLGLHALSFVLVAAVAADLLFQLGLKEAL